MPNPENIFRMVTGPKSANRSVRKSRSMSPQPQRQSLMVRRRVSAVSNHAAPYLASGHPSRRARCALLRMRSRRAERGLHLRRRQLHGLAAATGGNLVRVVEDELGLHLVGLVVHLGAEQEQHGLGIDQDLAATILDHLVGGPHFMGVFDRVGLPGAAAVLD